VKLQISPIPTKTLLRKKSVIDFVSHFKITVATAYRQQNYQITQVDDSSDTDNKCYANKKQPKLSLTANQTSPPNPVSEVTKSTSSCPNSMVGQAYQALLLDDKTGTNEE
jgi:hypothetical protein